MVHSVRVLLVLLALSGCASAPRPTMSKQTLYVGMIEEQTKETGVLQTYWARATHPGEAVEKMLASARANGLADPQIIAVDPYRRDGFDVEIEPDAMAEIFWSVGRSFFPPEPIFRLPYGITGSHTDGKQDVPDIRSGFHRHRNDHGLTTIGINVERKQLLPLYERLLRIRDSYVVFWYLIHDHWHEDKSLFLANESLTTASAILAHVRSHERDSILNGYVTLTAYIDEGATNINLTEHKRILITTFSDALAGVYAAELVDAGFPATDELVSIDQRMHHWHYRHPSSRDRDELVQHLRSIGFEPWNPGGDPRNRE